VIDTEKNAFATSNKENITWELMLPWIYYKSDGSFIAIAQKKTVTIC
jgi:hypothetical protein